ncbi:helix-turn-helix domain-containing protein [Actinobacillus equuli subsp. haemolyticus]|uniref:helix-turn-helix domain-containing protein n=1 Tax=Actinobacillus equuli TaxID=718 RepID=UPI0024432772|nr:helix-turn-helix domain-containing protein [Actinobacillus equuli]WGE81004.1 helix-turn-helix domain-containing protein [Actinobacillus equuli subsp. haemolyticus]
MTIQHKNSSPTRPKMNGIERQLIRETIIVQLLKGEISQGQALRRLRVEALGINQQDYLKLAKVSRQTLSNIENDKGNYSIETINQVFKPMGLKLGLMPISKDLMDSFLK